MAWLGQQWGRVGSRPRRGQDWWQWGDMRQHAPWIVAKGLLLMRAGLSPELNPTIVLPALGFRPDKPIAEWLP